MIENIDENTRRLLAFLRGVDLEEDTILIFMTDNGSTGNTFVAEDPDDPGAYRPLAITGAEAPASNNPADLAQGFNAGMRGQKASPYDGGHRVPFFIRWPGGGIEGGRDVDRLSAHIDIMPTLTDPCGTEPGEATHWDGASLAPLLRTPGKVTGVTEPWSNPSAR